MAEQVPVVGPTATSVTLGLPPQPGVWILMLHADGRFEFNPAATAADFAALQTEDPRNAAVVKAFAQRDVAMGMLLKLKDVDAASLDAFKGEVAAFFGVPPNPAQGTLPLAGAEDPFAV